MSSYSDFLLKAHVSLLGRVGAMCDDFTSLSTLWCGLHLVPLGQCQMMMRLSRDELKKL